MKALLVCLFIGSFMCGLFSCSKDDIAQTAPLNVTTVRAVPDYGAAMFYWNFPSDSTIDYVGISYSDTLGNIVNKKYSKFTTDAYVDGLSFREYTFALNTFNSHQNISSTQQFKLTPYRPVYDIVSPSITTSVGFGSAKFLWLNPTGKVVRISVSYIDDNGFTQTSADSSSSQSDSLVITGLNSTKAIQFTVQAMDGSGRKSKDRLFELTPLFEQKFDKSTWSVTADAEETIGEGAVNGFAKAAIDGDITTFWHTSWYASTPDYPHWIAVDLKQDVVLSRVALTPRQNKVDGFSLFNIDGSLDGVNWVTYGTGLNLIQENDTQFFSVNSNPKVRYVRIYAISSAIGSYYAHLAEIDIYGGK